MAHTLEPVERNTLLYSILIPAHNEERNIAATAAALAETLRAEGIPFEIVVADDDSQDATARTAEAAGIPELRVVRKGPPCGLGRAIRFGLGEVRGDAVAVVMADRSDDPADVAASYRKLEEGYDCVFGSRFIPGGGASDYPRGKLAANRLANALIRLLFLTRHNDMTNAFKVYRRHVIDSITPLHAAHFNITVEMSLSALIRRYRIAAIPIRWYGRTWGQSHLRVGEMGRRYLCTLLKLWFERLLILDDLIAEKQAEAGERPWSAPPPED